MSPPEWTSPWNTLATSRFRPAAPLLSRFLGFSVGLVPTGI